MISDISVRLLCILTTTFAVLGGLSFGGVRERELHLFKLVLCICGVYMVCPRYCMTAQGRSMVTSITSPPAGAQRQVREADALRSNESSRSE